MPVELPLLVKEIHRQAQTRLVKLLYLADLEWRRQHGGAPLAQLTWRFLHFGPYACELTGLPDGPDVEKIEFQTGKVAHRLTLGSEALESC
jgi:hypothetical protein